MPAVNLGGARVAYTIRESKRARRISVRYSQRHGLEVVYPRGITSPAPEELLQEKSAWVLATRERFREAAKGLPTRTYESGEVFHVLGRPFTLKLLTDPDNEKTSVKICDAAIVLSMPVSFPVSSLEARRGAIEAYYRELAKNYLPERVRELAAAHGFQYARVRVKNQKTRWGSCSSKGNINLNLRLMMAPEQAIDYVIVHELCHLQVMNHSPEFWALVETCFPDYRNWRSWFKQHSAGLIL